MIFDALGSGDEGSRHLKAGAESNHRDSGESSPATSRSRDPQSGPVACAITGPALLQTEQVLLRRAPEFVPIIQQIRRGGSMAVQSGDPDHEGTYNLYRVSASPECCKMIADALARALEVQRGHPASLRVLVNIWQKLQQQMS